MKKNIILYLLLCLIHLSESSRAQKKYPGPLAKTGLTGSYCGLSDDVMPVQAVWFWSEYEFQADGYKTFIDQAALHSPYDMVSASVRLWGRESTSDAVHNQMKLAAQYASAHGLSLVADLDVRTARRTFESKYPDELQEMLLLREVTMPDQSAVETVVKSKDLTDHYTGNTTHYIPLYGKLLLVYSYVVAKDGIDPNSLKDITRNCLVVSSSKDSVRVRIPAQRENTQATVFVSFTHLYPDVFAPHLKEFQREIINQYADVPLAGVFKDEWGFPPCFDGSPTKNQFWYSKHRAHAYAGRTGGRDLLADCLLMHLGIKGREQERQMTINHFMEMSWQRNKALEEDFYSAVKEVFGPDAAVTTHPTWWPYPDLHEQMKNGLDWWVVKRDWAQTDEYTPFAVRTALAKKWGSPIWYNMYYSANKSDYEKSVWSAVLGGGRINYHPEYPTDMKEIGKHLELFRGDLMLAESRVRLLNYITQSPLNCPVAVVFGHACTMNWAGPAYDDVGMKMVDRLWKEGIPTDLIPSSEIENNNLTVDDQGWVHYGAQKYAAVILYHPEFSRSVMADFFNQAAKGRTSLFRIGHWTKDFDGHAIEGARILPSNMPEVSGDEQLVSSVKNILSRQKIQNQTPAIEGAPGGFAYSFVTPPTTGYCRLIDGTYIQVAGTNNVGGDLIRSTVNINGKSVTFDATGVAAVRLDNMGTVQAMAAGGLKLFRRGNLKIELSERIDLALWKDNQDHWSGVIQGLKGEIPLQLKSITPNWKRINRPVPLSD
jgi:hypothetical protein